MSEEKKKGLESGEEYITVQVGGKEGFRVSLFPNKEKKEDNEPDYTSYIGVAAWKNKKK